MAGVVTAPPIADVGRAPKKKFATPPVKIACLACRASRTRCDGGHPCASCASRSRECVYRPSRRGGARVRRKVRQPGDLSQELMALPSDMESDEVPQEPIALENYIEPGAGLKQLQDFFQDSDFIFDSLFMSGISNSSGGETTSESSFGLPVQPIPIVRTYKSDAAILDAYYIFIHPFFPILPPPTRPAADQLVPHYQNDTTSFENGFEPSSPIALAISAILALIPCPNDLNHLDHESVVFRRKYAQYLAQSAVESIEIESEIPESSVEPPKALDEHPDDFPRIPFHPALPVQLESIVALDILSVYEYAQRGNLKKMQSRAGQALMSAMALSIHTNTGEDDEFREAKRRVFWMTYICVCQGAIVSNSEPTFAVFAPSFTSKYPVLEADPDAFALFIQSQQAILAATQFVLELNKTVKANGDMSRIYQRMQELELFLEPLIAQSDAWSLPGTPTSSVDAGEAVVSRALKCISRIKLNSARIKVHRYCAFYDIPVFSGKHCDLKSKAERDDESLALRTWPSCSCSSMMSLPSNSPSVNGSLSPQTAASKLSPTPEDQKSSPHMHTSFPFSSHHSAKVCLKSALNISSSFADLPYPNPSGEVTPPPAYLSPASSIISPRTMPSFACCAMQCAYSLLMVHHKTKAMYPESGSGGPLVDSLILRLRQGLTSISATLENYATAFEALGGMRDQIRTVIESCMIFDIS